MAKHTVIAAIEPNRTHPPKSSSSHPITLVTYSINNVGYIALSVAPDTQAKYPHSPAADSPNASSTHATPAAGS